MAVLAEIERISHLLNQATTKLGAGITVGEPVQVGRINEGTKLVYGIFPYQRRATGVPGRLLTYGLTRQPVLAIKDGAKITPLAYAEDVARHPLSDRLIGELEALSINGAD